MNAPISHVRNKADFDSRVEAALFEASLDAIEIARRTGTSVVVSQDGKIVELTCDEAQAQFAREYAERIACASSPPTAENRATS